MITKRQLTTIFYYVVGFCIFIFLTLRLPVSYLAFNEKLYEHLFLQQKVLFVTAHPDDEVVFFGPTINSLRRIVGAENIFLLAMTNGNYEGKGRTREKEIVEGFKVLGLNSGHIHFYKHEAPLVDHPDIHLPFKELAVGIEEHVKKLNINTIITFDDMGVSGHLNHGDIYRAISRHWPSNEAPDALILKSVNYFRKHFSIFDLPISFFLDALFNGDLVFISGHKDVEKTKKSLYVHKSQYTTFHNVLHHFSDRFLFINSLRKYEIPLANPGKS
ncbi:N-acetylglucosaminyl-phosphatidylinositol de-N-acetylase-like [Hydractinia symbiolongicarpus]|uniref:N-acetylglucosaminyl-phosphatidylinositol de-N-acetylase-like n=1 Tax=Hydractinia symbiolongicarpus TaxID=13093 RepID=UPI00254C8006|nr:N-acetylglucosaminyl-phosphatidylinositol de-N-acetylase-like [Hydractinia symbiolongicarpus]